DVSRSHYCFPAVVCKQCGAVLFSEATPSGFAETKGEIDQRATVEAKASLDEKTSAVKLEQQELLDDTLQAGIAYDGVPDIMSALMSSDPRAMTFETQHFGALRLALEFMHQDHHLLANSSNVESLDGQSTAAATSSSPRMLQVTASPYYPQAASRLRVKAAQNTKPLQLTLEGITSVGRKAAPFSSSSQKDEEFGGIAGARRRQRILAAEVTAKAEASTSTSQRVERNTEHSKLTLDAEKLHRHFISVTQQAHNVCSQDVSGTQEQQSRDKGIALGDILRPPFKSALEGLGIVQHSWRTPALVAAAASRKRGRIQGDLHSSLSQTKQENTEDKAVVRDEQNDTASHNFVAPSPTSFGSATFWDPESAVGGPFSPNPLPAT
ncbi:Hypothetical protein, putative, partial [Bodo saltans]